MNREFPQPRSAYVHIPFCASKCYYCDFNSYTGMESAFADYVRALIVEIKRAGSNEHGGGEAESRPPLDTVYFGGGTPTLLPAADLGGVIGVIRHFIGIAPNAEVTIEANPGTVHLPKLSRLRQSGFNRLSLGIQSFDDEFLASIGRGHTRLQALDAYEAARQAGFDNVGIDLIFALPGQSLAHWEHTLETALTLWPKHISLYELSIEQGTHFAQLRAEGSLQMLDEDTQLAMYELAITKLTEAGYEHYEVSNFARPGFRSRHNEVYWLNHPYYGFGAGATSYIDGVRARKVAAPRDYIGAIESGLDAVELSESLDDRARLGETIVQGLRMLDGVEIDRIRRETGLDPLVEYAAQIEKLMYRGLIQQVDGHLRVTYTGLLLLNDVSREFV